ncbi:hypothetical protein [Devosia sp. MC1541]|uniref:hypothetical protein n=1 Tax=Devosia sp. MC1541 TaxID=2725264 RepID=UPI00145D119C|nr:hypothetical protein [Devosia sp. MC1541]
MAKRFNYDKMQGTTNRLLDKFQQGTVQLKRIKVTPPANNWEEGTETETIWTLKATVKRVHQRYENGTLIVETGDILTVATKCTLIKDEGEDVTPVEQAFAPENGDLLIIDGALRAIDNITPLPGAGVASTWKLWSKA